MTWTVWMRGGGLTVSAAVGLAVSGCGNAHTAEQNVPATVAGDHSGWWCPEHGVPEEICAQCSSKLAAEYQKKGDWCKEHNRPESQCFVCHPELQEKFAAQYLAKFGDRPPEPAE